MRVEVEAKPKARQEKVERVTEKRFRVWVKELPEGGKANAAIERALARFLKVTPARLRVVSGKHSRRKIIEIS